MYRTCLSFSRPRGSFSSHQISVLLYNEKQRLRCLVPQQISISVMTHKVLFLHTIAVVGSEEVFACFSCLKLCSIVLRFYEADILNPLQISQIFHITLVLPVAFSAACLSFAELEEFPLHTSRHQLLGYSFFTLSQSGDVAMDTSYSSSYDTVLVKLRVQARRNRDVRYVLAYGLPSPLMIRSR